MKRTIIFFTAFIMLALSLGSVSAAPATPKKALSFMFTLSAGKATIKPVKNGEYVLAMNLPDVSQVTVFGQGPNSMVRTLTGKELENIWTQGDNSFINDPPNAVLSAEDMRPIVVTLTGSKMKGNRAFYQFKRIGGGVLPKAYKVVKKVTLTVDSGMIGCCIFGDSGEQCCTDNGGAWISNKNECMRIEE